MDITKHDLTIGISGKDSPYEVGGVYLVALSDDLLLSRCVESEDGNFGFDVLHTMPRPLAKDGSGNYAI